MKERKAEAEENHKRRRIEWRRNPKKDDANHILFVWGFSSYNFNLIRYKKTKIAKKLFRVVLLKNIIFVKIIVFLKYRLIFLKIVFIKVKTKRLYFQIIKKEKLDL